MEVQNLYTMTEADRETDLRTSRSGHHASDSRVAFCYFLDVSECHTRACFLAATKLRSREGLVRMQRLVVVHAANICRQALLQIPSSSHCRGRPQQLEPLGYSG